MIGGKDGSRTLMPPLRAASARMSEVRPQIHAGIEAGDLIAIAVERQGRPALRQEAATLADAPLGCLAPARVVDLRIDVRIEAVLARILLIPGGRRLLVDQ